MMQSSEFGIVNFDKLDVLTIGTTAVGNFTKSYLGAQGRQHILADIEKGTWQLKPGWREARYAVVTATGSSDMLGVVAEYADGTFIMLNQYAGKTGKSGRISTISPKPRPRATASRLDPPAARAMNLPPA